MIELKKEEFTSIMLESLAVLVAYAQMAPRVKKARENLKPLAESHMEDLVKGKKLGCEDFLLGGKLACTLEGELRH